MNNPFDYEPSAVMLEAQKHLIAHIESLCNANPAFKEEVSKGKMFGVLRTTPPRPSPRSPVRARASFGVPSIPRGEETNNTPTSGQFTISPPWEGLGEVVLFAFSGQICGSFNWPQFIPPVFDYLDENGYFKVHEREISAINHQIEALGKSPKIITLRDEYSKLQVDADEDIEAYRRKMKAAKLERDLIRGKGLADEAELIRESQFMKAEMHRKKLYWKEQLEAVSSKINGFIGTMNSLKLQRQQKSDALQRWLFEQFVFTNPHTSEKKNLLEIFKKYYRDNSLSLPLKGRVGERLSSERDGGGSSFLPPSGSGECCEPKLLHFAIEHNLEPIEIGMFWWGESPKQEVRHHLQFYPACNGKCKPILEWTLSATNGGTSPSMGRKDPLCFSSISPLMGRTGLESREALLPIEGEVGRGSLIFEDNFIILVNKPSGMLSVPGRSNRPSVFSILKEKYPECDELQMVHRLDMDTSGLLVVAKTKEVHKNLQRQFAEHTIKKEYVAILSKPLSSEKGTISLPLRPDYDDRPRQIVDKINGKTAVTMYQRTSKGQAPLLSPPRGEDFNCAESGVLANSSPWGRSGGVVRLFPLTGRTHQLRVHCAHREGLDNPIKGDRLYGKKADRLYLHAEYLEFTHPITGERMHFRVKPEWESPKNND